MRAAAVGLRVARACDEARPRAAAVRAYRDGVLARETTLDDAFPDAHYFGVVLHVDVRLAGAAARPDHEWPLPDLPPAAGSAAECRALARALVHRLVDMLAWSRIPDMLALARTARPWRTAIAPEWGAGEEDASRAVAALCHAGVAADLAVLADPALLLGEADAHAAQARSVRALLGALVAPRGAASWPWSVDDVPVVPSVRRLRADRARLAELVRCGFFDTSAGLAQSEHGLYDAAACVLYLAHDATTEDVARALLGLVVPPPPPPPTAAAAHAPAEARPWTLSRGAAHPGEEAAQAPRPAARDAAAARSPPTTSSSTARAATCGSSPTRPRRRPAAASGWRAGPSTSTRCARALAREPDDAAVARRRAAAARHFPAVARRVEAAAAAGEAARFAACLREVQARRLGAARGPSPTSTAEPTPSALGLALLLCVVLGAWAGVRARLVLARDDAEPISCAVRRGVGARRRARPGRPDEDRGQRLRRGARPPAGAAGGGAASGARGRRRGGRLPGADPRRGRRGEGQGAVEDRARSLGPLRPRHGRGLRVRRPSHCHRDAAPRPRRLRRRGEQPRGAAAGRSA